MTNESIFIPVLKKYKSYEASRAELDKNTLNAITNILNSHKSGIFKKSFLTQEKFEELEEIISNKKNSVKAKFTELMKSISLITIFLKEKKDFYSKIALLHENYLNKNAELPEDYLKDIQIPVIENIIFDQLKTDGKKYSELEEYFKNDQYNALYLNLKKVYQNHLSIQPVRTAFIKNKRKKANNKNKRLSISNESVLKKTFGKFLLEYIKKFPEKSSFFNDLILSYEIFKGENIQEEFKYLCERIEERIEMLINLSNDNSDLIYKKEKNLAEKIDLEEMLRELKKIYLSYNINSSQLYTVSEPLVKNEEKTDAKLLTNLSVFKDNINANIKNMFSDSSKNNLLPNSSLENFVNNKLEDFKKQAENLFSCDNYNSINNKILLMEEILKNYKKIAKNKNFKQMDFLKIINSNFAKIEAILEKNNLIIREIEDNISNLLEEVDKKNSKNFDHFDFNKKRNKIVKALENANQNLIKLMGCEENILNNRLNDDYQNLKKESERLNVEIEKTKLEAACGEQLKNLTNSKKLYEKIKNFKSNYFLIIKLAEKIENDSIKKFQKISFKILNFIEQLEVFLKEISEMLEKINTNPAGLDIEYIQACNFKIENIKSYLPDLEELENFNKLTFDFYKNKSSILLDLKNKLHSNISLYKQNYHVVFSFHKDKFQYNTDIKKIKKEFQQELLGFEYKYQILNFNFLKQIKSEKKALSFYRFFNIFGLFKDKCIQTENNIKLLEDNAKYIKDVLDKTDDFIKDSSADNDLNKIDEFLTMITDNSVLKKEMNKYSYTINIVEKILIKYKKVATAASKLNDEEKYIHLIEKDNALLNDEIKDLHKAVQQLEPKNKFCFNFLKPDSSSPSSNSFLPAFKSMQRNSTYS